MSLLKIEVTDQEPDVSSVGHKKSLVKWQTFIICVDLAKRFAFRRAESLFSHGQKTESNDGQSLVMTNGMIAK